jgi:hypothetical protein
MVEKLRSGWWRKDIPRPHLRSDGIPTRIDSQWQTIAEKAIGDAMQAVENMGASIALTDAVTFLSKARDRVADHVERRRSMELCHQARLVWQSMANRRLFEKTTKHKLSVHRRKNMTLPNKLDEYELSIFMQKQLGIQLKGDAELHMMGGIPLRLADQIPAATVTTAMTNAGITDGDATTVTNVLTKKKATK